MRIVVFGDTHGVPQLQRHLPQGFMVAVIAAEIRPQYFEPLQIISDSNEIPLIIQPRHASTNYPAFVEALTDLAPDFIMVNSYSMKLHPDILVLPKHGAVNIHGALLPQYRGANPIQWAILNDDKETGVTMHYMDDDFDTGDLIAQKKVPINVSDTWLDVQKRITRATEEMLRAKIPDLLNGTSGRLPQNENKARHWPRRKPEDGLIDWRNDVHYIYNLIRSLVKPLPGAFYFDEEGRKIVIDYFLSIEDVRRLQNKQNRARH
ncbi:MAG: methionyl-tRNA formyltransferase [Nitrospirae bacterium]|nr:methionyl-tRNA formyltransferase [Nitrospirota bacterium]